MSKRPSLAGEVTGEPCVMPQTKWEHMEPAAGEWREGTPDEPGRYLVEYGIDHPRTVGVMKYEPHKGWVKHAMHTEVFRYAEINSEHA